MTDVVRKRCPVALVLCAPGNLTPLCNDLNHFNNKCTLHLYSRLQLLYPGDFQDCVIHKYCPDQWRSNLFGEMHCRNDAFLFLAIYITSSHLSTSHHHSEKYLQAFGISLLLHGKNRRLHSVMHASCCP